MVVQGSIPWHVGIALLFLSLVFRILKDSIEEKRRKAMKPTLYLGQELLELLADFFVNVAAGTLPFPLSRHC